MADLMINPQKSIASRLRTTVPSLRQRAQGSQSSRSTIRRGKRLDRLSAAASTFLKTPWTRPTIGCSFSFKAP
ncbi:MAG: hypothetical protein GY737_29345 [Desulfobacteraceae bacterium]|nr:hypothetical protein [Desulfobacteraceae bacterium]